MKIELTEQEHRFWDGMVEFLAPGIVFIACAIVLGFVVNSVIYASYDAAAKYRIQRADHNYK